MSKYLKKFSTVSEYNTYINGSPDLPNVSYITATGESEVNSMPKAEDVDVANYDGATTFDWNKYIKGVTITDNITRLSVNGYINLPNLVRITVDSNNSVFDSRDNCNAAIETSTNKLVFGCNSTVIPNTVTSIDKNAFKGCGIITVTIPESVTSIGNGAFKNCSNLASVTVLATTPPTLGTSAFDNNASGRKIYVPAESVEAYKAATNWSTYAADIEAIPTT